MIPSILNYMIGTLTSVLKVSMMCWEMLARWWRAHLWRWNYGVSHHHWNCYRQSHPECNESTLFTRVSAHRSWIEETIHRFTLSSMPNLPPVRYPVRNRITELFTGWFSAHATLQILIKSWYASIDLHPSKMKLIIKKSYWLIFIWHRICFITLFSSYQDVKRKRWNRWARMDKVQINWG